ncbi:hypothetical protein HDU84_007571 [Entophlyctis sp. JEL0112]|nr:hypothetical protein HDU84_007571 [Entophlyctis sp. JEL0112]
MRDSPNSPLPAAVVRFAAPAEAGDNDDHRDDADNMLTDSAVPADAVPTTPASPQDPMDTEPALPMPPRKLPFPRTDDVQRPSLTACPAMSAGDLSDIDAILPPSPGLEIVAQTIHRWHIDDWKSMRTMKKAYSPIFEFSGTKWRILIFPNGNNSDNLAVFLDSVDAAAQPKDSNWHVCISFAIAISNPDDPSVFKHLVANHRYNPYELDWGFNHLIKLSALSIPIPGNSKAFVEDENRTVISVFMKHVKDETGVLWHNFVNYDSKKVTGFVGLKNQGATCYMNSLLQSLYFVNYFRAATFNIPTENDEPTKSIPLALQRVFYQLQFSDQSVGTTELTKSFGWDTIDSFMQHDVQEFNRVLQDNLESKMKGTKAEGAISRLFVGKYKSYIKCINVPYESSRIEDFYDIQLNVKGFKNLEESFVDYINVETLDGENKYMAGEGYGLQAARKGVIFTKFPPVLHLQLKRFEYDMERDAMVKINDRYEFPTEIDLTRFLDESSEEKSLPQKYLLHGVLVHAGDLSGGHYCAFLRSEKNGKWYKFDDDRVTPVSQRDAMEENFGADPTVKTKMIKRFTNAYMLVYIREADADEILKPITGDDIPLHLRTRFEEERIATEQKRRDREEQHLYLSVKYFTNADIRAHDGFDLCNFDNKDLPLSPSTTVRVKKDERLATFKEHLAETLGVAKNKVKVWSIMQRQNRTSRVDKQITEDDKSKFSFAGLSRIKPCVLALEQIRDYYKGASEHLRLYVDTDDDLPIDLFVKNEADSVLIFIKHYDPRSAKIRFAGKALFSPTQRLEDALPTIMDIAGLQGPNVQLYEEVKPGMIELCDLNKTFMSAELGTGDILCIQHALVLEDLKALTDPRSSSVVNYFEDYRNRLPVVFKQKTKEKETALPDLELVLSKKMIYDTVVSKLGAAVKWDPEKIQLSSPQGTFAKTVIKRSATLTLQEMTNPGYYAPANGQPTLLFFELLDIPLSELEIKRYVSVTYVDRSQHEHGPYKMLVAKSGRVADLLALLLPLLTVSPGGSGQFRLFEVSHYRTFKVYSDTDYVSGITDYNTLYAEEIPVEEINKSEGDMVIEVAHFNKEPSRGHGVPFRFVLKAGEPFSQTKTRLVASIGATDKDAGKLKFFVVSNFSKPKPIEDDDVLWDVFPKVHVNEYLGIDHIDRSGKSAKGTGGGGIKILN